MLPLAAPAEVGAYWTVNEVPWPAGIVTGKVRPAMEKPAPVTVALLTCRAAVPLFANAIDCVLDWPTVMLLKLRDDGDSEICACVAFPWSEMLKFEPAEEALAVTPEDTLFGATALDALLATVTAPEMLPADCGVNSSSTVTLCPAAMVADEVPTKENPLPETLRPEIATGPVPVSLSVTDCVALLPTATVPKSTELVLAERMPGPELACDAVLALLAALVV